MKYKLVLTKKEAQTWKEMFDELFVPEKIILDNSIESRIKQNTLNDKRYKSLAYMLEWFFDVGTFWYGFTNAVLYSDYICCYRTTENGKMYRVQFFSVANRWEPECIIEEGTNRKRYINEYTPIR